MAIRRAQRPTTVVADNESLSAIARRVFGDDRVTTLIMDLNPGVSVKAPPVGSRVRLPTKAEAQKFASQMGFSLGFDPSKGGGTVQRRKWSRLKDGRKPPPGAVDIAALARQLRADAEEDDALVGRVLAAQEDTAFVQSFIADGGDDLDGVRAAVGGEKERLAVKRQLLRLREIFAAQTTPRAREKLCRALVDPECAAGLSRLFVPAKISAPLAGPAHVLLRVHTCVTRHARRPQLMLQRAADAEGLAWPVVLAARQATEAGLTTFDAAVIAAAGGAAFAALDAHVQKLLAQLDGALESIDKIPVAHLKLARAGQKVAGMPKAWVLSGALLHRFGARAEQVTAAGRLDGLACLLKESARQAGGWSASELAARARRDRSVSLSEALQVEIATGLVALWRSSEPAALRWLGPTAGRALRVRAAALEPRGHAGDEAALDALWVERHGARLGAIGLDGAAAARSLLAHVKVDGLHLTCFAAVTLTEAALGCAGLVDGLQNESGQRAFEGLLRRYAARILTRGLELMRGGPASGADSR